MRMQVHTGHDGWVFQTGGDQRIIDSYCRESAFTPELATAWVERLADRANRLQAQGIDYVHVIVPDKLTLLDRHYQENLENPQGSPVRQLHARYTQQLPSLLHVIDYLQSQIDNYPLYWKTDKHWTAWGCFMVYQLLCHRLQIQHNPDILNYSHTRLPLIQPLGQAALSQSAHAAVDAEVVRTYNLNRFSTRRYANQVVRYRESCNLDSAAEQLLGSAASPMSNEQLALHDDLISGAGSHVVYRNEHKAAVDKTIVLFGDSFSDYRRTLLTGMLAETVREVHFIWSPSIDEDYLRLIRPDIVITQHSEARLLEMPDDDFSWIDSTNRALRSLESAYAKAQRTGFTDCPFTAQRPETGSTQLLDREIYTLDPPVMVQSGCDRAHQDLTMQSNAVALQEFDQSQLYFHGERFSLEAADDTGTVDYDLASLHGGDQEYEAFQTLTGRTCLLAPTRGALVYSRWMLDCLPGLGLLQRQGLSLNDIDHFLVPSLTDAFQMETLKTLGIHESRIVEAMPGQRFRCETLLYVALDNGINLKMNRLVPLWLKQTYLTPSEPSGRVKLYISRPDEMRGSILNEDKLLPIVREAGFSVVTLEGLSVTEQASLFSRADAIVAPQGEALTNLVFCRPGIQVVELLGHQVCPYYYGLAGMCGHRYHAVMTDPAADFPRLVSYRLATAFGHRAVQRRAQNESFTVDLVVLERLLKEIPAVH